MTTCGTPSWRAKSLPLRRRRPATHALSGETGKTMRQAGGTSTPVCTDRDTGLGLESPPTRRGWRAPAFAGASSSPATTGYDRPWPLSDADMWVTVRHNAGHDGGAG